MATSKTNVIVATCDTCEAIIEPQEGTRVYQWSDDDRFLCSECQAKRVKREAALKADGIAAGQGIVKLLPAIEKLGDIITVRAGDGVYSSEVRYIGRDGREYQLTLTRKEAVEE